jgi:ABC-type bacteriocin/lantibiotic exporter with double-glycine peptidase domain
MKKTTQREILQKFLRVLRLMRPYWWSLANVMIVGIIIQAIGMAVPYFSQLLIDVAYANYSVTLMQLLVIAIIVVNVATVVMRNLRNYANTRLSARLNNGIGLQFFNHIQHLPIRFFDERRTGEILSRFQDINASLNTVINSFQTICMSGIYLLLIPPLLFYMNWKLALMALLSIPLNVYSIYLSGRASRPYLQKTAEAYAELRGVQIEFIDNIKTLKTMALEPHIYQKTANLMQQAMQVQFKTARIGNTYNIINGLTRSLSTALYTWFGWHMIFSAKISLGEFIAFTTYVGYLYGPVSDFISLFSDLQQSAVNSNRMFEYLDKSPEQDPQQALIQSQDLNPILKGEIALKAVDFSYTSGKPVLQQINLHISPGTVTAVVGPSGSGKTSLLRLITRLDIPDAGEICFDSLAVSNIPLRALRSQIAVVWQEVGLIKGTFWDNLTLGVTNPSRELVTQIVHLCCLAELIESLPQKYETEIAERGATLSAGQRQRMAIARALIRQTPILILDEATANIDVETEMTVLNNILTTFPEKTIIFVSHRLASASLADQICVLESGRLAEVGNHQGLLSQNGLYYRMCEKNQLLDKAPLAAPIYHEKSARAVDLA